MILFALRKIREQLDKINNDLGLCTGAFIALSRLLYAYKIKARLEEDSGIIKLSDIHFHWYFEKLATLYTRSSPEVLENLEHFIDPLLAVHESAITRIKSRPNDPAELFTRAELAF